MWDDIEIQGKSASCYINRGTLVGSDRYKRSVDAQKINSEMTVLISLHRMPHVFSVPGPTH